MQEAYEPFCTLGIDFRLWIATVSLKSKFLLHPFGALFAQVASRLGKVRVWTPWFRQDMGPQARVL